VEVEVIAEKGVKS